MANTAGSSPRRAVRANPGRRGPAAELIAAIVELKRRNPKFGCVRIAEQLSHAFVLEIDKDVVRRVLAQHYWSNGSDGSGLSWLNLIAQSKDSLWSVDLFSCESILLRSYWVMRVMDVFTRRIIGIGVERADIDGVAVCRPRIRLWNGRSAPFAGSISIARRRVGCRAVTRPVSVV